MAPSFPLLLSLLVAVVVAGAGFAAPQSVIRTWPERSQVKRGDDTYCQSWRFSVETNDAGAFAQVPDRCVRFVREYMTGEQYASDCGIVASDSISFADGALLLGDGKDAWIFDIDETLLSNLPYYAAHGFGSEIFNETAFDEWVNLADAPAIPASLVLYKELKRLGFKLILLTGRSEPQRSATARNLIFAGYSSWDRLILRGLHDVGKPASIYKAGKRAELEAEGYRIHGNSGDQWSDLVGLPMSVLFSWDPGKRILNWLTTNNPYRILIIFITTTDWGLHLRIRDCLEDALQRLFDERHSNIVGAMHMGIARYRFGKINACIKNPACTNCNG